MKLGQLIALLLETEVDQSMNWNDFKTAAPELAEAGEKLFERVGVVMVGSIRKDGSPRISPVEPLFAGNELYFGMMPDTLKAHDLLRDGRCTIHNVISDKNAAEGEFKINGVMRTVEDESERQLYCDGLKAKIGWSPAGLPFALFAVQVQSAGIFIMSGHAEDPTQGRTVTIWREGELAQTYRQAIDGKLIPTEN
ncbi:MAG: pyridoxamine 5'-phosphate oxidase family protein [Blastocatellia bacterium]